MKPGASRADYPGKSALRHAVQIRATVGRHPRGGPDLDRFAGHYCWSLPGIKLAAANSTVNLLVPKDTFAARFFRKVNESRLTATWC
jgi:hypothetical protein